MKKSFSKVEIFLFSVIAFQFFIILYFSIFLEDEKVIDNNYFLLNPSVAELESTDFKLFQDNYYQTLKPLRISLNNYLNNINHNETGIYIEHLTSGAWIGINEKDSFVWGSLLKLPIAICVMKTIEDTNLTLNSSIKIIPEDVNKDFGYLGLEDNIVGKYYTIKQLLNYSLTRSDNTANNVLTRICADEDYINSFYGSGVETNEIQMTQGYYVSPKLYSSFFRTLYNSGFLKKKNSNYLLSLLSNSLFKEGIPAGVDKEVIISHKIGMKKSENQFHDCGIVYYKEEAYIICVMTKNLDYDKSNKVISDISRITFLFFSQNN